MPVQAEDVPEAIAGEKLKVLGYAVNGGADEVALSMLTLCVEDLPVAIGIDADRMQANELVVAGTRSQGVGDLLCGPPAEPLVEDAIPVEAAARRSAGRRIAVGAGRRPRSPTSSQPLLDAGADHVASELVDIAST